MVLSALRQNKNKQLIPAVLAEKQLFVIVFPWRLQIVKNLIVGMLKVY